ncbi:hypothetical protein AX279_19525 [Pseudomonas sp. J237]|nr:MULTISPECIES: hypothetical protein [Pseudomonas]OEO24026.1 hypothetical protein AX279_19525 [Pseudomonas sp. J237]
MEELIEARRKAFEAWRLAKFCGGDERLKKCSNAPDVYYYAAEQEAWKVWSAALDRVVIDLPPAEAMTGDDGVDSEVMQPRRVIEAIHAAGIKTKVGT